MAADKKRREEEHQARRQRELELQAERDRLEELREAKAKETLDIRVSRDKSTARSVEEYITTQRNAEVQRRRLAEEEREAKLEALKKEHNEKVPLLL